jgi:hypothetical protein
VIWAGEGPGQVIWAGAGPGQVTWAGAGSGRGRNRRGPGQVRASLQGFQSVKVG